MADDVLQRMFEEAEKNLKRFAEMQRAGFIKPATMKLAPPQIPLDYYFQPAGVEPLFEDYREKLI